MKTDLLLNTFKQCILLNKDVNLNDKEHIKKYSKVRKIHNTLTSRMVQELLNSINGKLTKMAPILLSETNINFKEFYLYPDNPNDLNIMHELFVYKNHDSLKSLTEIYLEEKKYENEKEHQMLIAMSKSVVSLFRIVECDPIDGYVTYFDVFNKKRYKLIDIAMSSMEISTGSYIYNRLITYDDITFGIGLPCIFTKNNIKIKKFIKTHKYNKCSNYSRCVILYDICRNKSNIKFNNYYDY